MLKRFYKIIVWLVLFSIFFLSSGKSETVAPYTLKQLDSRSGLSNSSINALFQDSDNLLWVATWDGLNVYDGSGFHVFNYSKENIAKSIGNNVILEIIEDKNGYIWISTIEGVSKYDKNTGKFSNYFYKDKQVNSISEQEFTIDTDKNGNVYCLTKKYGLMVYDPVKDTFIPKKVPAAQNVMKFKFDENNHLWVLTKEGELLVFKSQDTGFKRSASFSAQHPVSKFFYVNHEIIALTSERELFSINGSFQKSALKQLDYEINDIGYYKDHYVVARANRGYMVYDRNFNPSTFLVNEMSAMKSMKINSICAGKDQILWCGTDGSGMIKVFQEMFYFSN